MARTISVGFISVPLNLLDVALNRFRIFSNGIDTVFRLGLDFPESFEAYVAEHDSDNAKECEDNSDDREPAIDIRRPVIQKLASEFVFDRNRDRRLGGRTGFHGRVVIRAVLVARWAGVGDCCLGRRRLAFSGGLARLRERNHREQSPSSQLRQARFEPRL